MRRTLCKSESLMVYHKMIFYLRNRHDHLFRLSDQDNQVDLRFNQKVFFRKFYQTFNYYFQLKKIKKMLYKNDKKNVIQNSLIKNVYIFEMRQGPTGFELSHLTNRFIFVE